MRHLPQKTDITPGLLREDLLVEIVFCEPKLLKECLEGLSICIGVGGSIGKELCINNKLKPNKLVLIEISELLTLY